MLTLDFNSILIGSAKPKILAGVYEQVVENPADWAEKNWHGWQVGSCFLTVGLHSEIKGKAREPQRVIFNFQTNKVKEEFARIKKLGATVIKEPYEMQGAWIATFADPDGNYFQLMSPWEGSK